MKKLIAIFAASAVLLAAGSCSSKEDPLPEPDPVAPTTMSLSPASLQVPQGGGTYSLEVTAPSRPGIVAKPDWVTVQDGTYQNYRIRYTISIPAFGEYESREGTLILSVGSLTAELKITQEGLIVPDLPQTNISQTPVTEGITPEAHALYDYLLEQYGHKTLSGVMANVNWNHEEADKVYRDTGRYPAINGYDFIHILYSGANWINYSDITPVKEWADAGGIVSLMWHFNVPKTQAAPGAVDGVTCTPSETTFQVARVFVDGSWEQVWFDYYVDQVAEVILQLQEAGIAAIWRPFHEAAGNYYSLKWKGAAWFWWGADGPETYKKVWNRLQDAFYAKGIRNLIWVWTAQDYNGDPTSYDCDAPYYPGDDRVDIIGRDLYGKDAEANYRDFVSAQTAYPTKMIALSENGKDGAVEFGQMPDVWRAGARWSWFMPWYGANMPSAAWWKTALSDENVITRDQIQL